MRYKFLLTLLGFALPGLLQANMLFNGGFETGDLTGWNQSDCSDSVSNVSPHSGNYSYADMTAAANTCSLFQQGIATIPGETYKLTFYFEFDSPQNPNTNHFAVTFDNTLLFSLNDINPGFSTVFFNRTITNGSPSELKFEFSTSVAGSKWKLDDVTLDAATPEPASLGLFGAGLGALWIWRRRRNGAH